MKEKVSSQGKESSSMWDFLFVLLFLALWIALQLWVLPKLGVPT